MSEKARLLFVDDEERIVNLLKIMFRGSYDVFTTTNGHEALKIMRDQHIHVLVSDQRMPEMTGIELLTQAREQSPDTMRILLTGYSDMSAIVGSVNEGEVFRFINKPWNQEDIKTTILDAATIAMATLPSVRAMAPSTRAAAQIASAPQTKRDVVVLDGSDNDRHWIASSFGKEFRTHQAATIEEALSLLVKHDVGVLVTEAMVQNQSTGTLLNILKRQYPLITTVMIAQSEDSESVIKLINEAQIYRFMTKPVRQASLALAVSSAMAQHERFRTDPALMARNKVAKSADADSGSLAASILKTVSALRSRFSFFAT